MTYTDRHAKLLALGSKEIKRRLDLLNDYYFSLLRINEQSLAAYEELGRVEDSLDRARKAWHEAKRLENKDE